MSEKRNFAIPIAKGSILDGKVESIRDFGMFININKQYTGILYKEDISPMKLKTPDELFSVGDNIKVCVKSFNEDTGRLVFSYKEMIPDWNELARKYSENMVTKGIVRNRYKNGIFVELEPNLFGLADYKNIASYGDKVNVIIKKISPEMQKIKLEILD